MSDLLGIGITQINGASDNHNTEKVTAAARLPIPNFSITRHYHRSGNIGVRGEELELTVIQAGKDADWALTLAMNDEFTTFEKDNWICYKTVIIQIGMTD